MKALSIIVIALACNLGFANTLDCEHIGTIDIKGDSASLAYSSEMNFNFQYDMATLISGSKGETVFQANRWGAYFTIPNQLISSQGQSANVNFSTPDEPNRVENCSHIGTEGLCAAQIRMTVEAWAHTDFPNQSLIALMPPVDEDLGSVQSYEVPIARRLNTSDVLGTYRLSVNEVCAITKGSFR